MGWLVGGGRWWLGGARTPGDGERRVVDRDGSLRPPWGQRSCWLTNPPPSQIEPCRIPTPVGIYGSDSGGGGGCLVGPRPQAVGTDISVDEMLSARPTTKEHRGEYSPPLRSPDLWEFSDLERSLDD